MNLELMIGFFLKDLHTKQRTPTIVEDSYTSSPYGVLVFKTIGKNGSRNRGVCFRPLTGRWSLRLGEVRITPIKVEEFPSPYGVLVFKTIEPDGYKKEVVCFRPLTGCWSLRLYLLQSPIYIASFIDLRGKPIILVKSYHKTAQKELGVNKIAYRGKKPIFPVAILAIELLIHQDN